MKLLFKQLVDDHLSLCYVLAFLEKAVRKWRSLDDVKNSEEFVLNSLEYLKDYSRLIHYPLEKNLLSILLRGNPGKSEKIVSICDQQEKMINQSEYLKQWFLQCIDNEQTDDINELKQLLIDFSRQYRKNISEEDSLLLPIMDNFFNSKNDQFANHLQIAEQQSQEARQNFRHILFELSKTARTI